MLLRSSMEHYDQYAYDGKRRSIHFSSEGGGLDEICSRIDFKWKSDGKDCRI